MSVGEAAPSVAKRREGGCSRARAELCYVPCIYAMLQKSLRKKFVYNQMMLMCFSEMMNIVMHAIVTGIESIYGDVYCLSPKRFYWFGVIELGSAYVQSVMLAILAFNRCLILIKPRMADTLFGQYGWVGTLLWQIPPFAIAFLLSWAGPPIIFNPMKGSQYFNPHLGYLPDNEYYHTPHIFSYYVSCFIFAVPVLYLSFGICLIRLIEQNSLHMNSKRVRKETSTFIQVFIGCVLLFFSCVGYIIQQQFPDAEWLALGSTYGYILFQGSSAITYLTLNRSIRQEIVLLFDRFSKGVHKNYPDKSATTRNNT
ncbi:serpentine type 7TM GPCR chemoreceptor srt domain-containing protein [Ditylenchus destructor]|uniref:Serpentine type 7TM GPCR chemoreceptor srt domain-containing protein n=1 Tax=Ditylenchus destructor TaxID=166010 RepID=A0AAD4R309_9BILA|nr:serpentine type 7TM GPCR chemoreceptor srt domain-containing protein [Ditylenchus destructor]